MELRLAALLLLACISFASAVPARRSNAAIDPASDDQIVQVLTDICTEVRDEVKDHVPAKFAELVHLLKSLPRATIARIDKQVHDNGFCDSGKLGHIWHDALIMDASEGSLKLIVEEIIRKDVSPVRANYLYTMMAFVRNPTQGAVRAVLPILEEKEVPRQALLGISALIRNARLSQETPELRSAVKSIVKYMDKNSKQQDRVVVALKALQNIGTFDEALDKVIRLASDASQKSAVRVAAIEALLNHATNQQVKEKCMEIFQKTKESSEIRIAAYKVAVESRDRQVVQNILQIIRREENKQVGAYVTTHLDNFVESSSPKLEEMRQILKEEKIPVERFPQDLRKYSRNFEFSQYIERLGVGAVFDADLIYDKSFAPRSIKMNLTVPASDSEFNVFELGFRQVGLEEEIRKLVGPNLKGRNAPEIMTEVVAQIVDLLDQESNDNEVPNGRFPRKIQKRQNIFNKFNVKDDVEAAFYLNVDGKTIAYFDIDDLSRIGVNDMSMAIRSIIQEVKRTEKVDRAFSLMFLNNEFEVPSKDGKKPAAINGTIMFAFKGDRNTFVPSVAFEMSTRVGDKKYLQRLSSSVDLRFDVQYRNNRPVKVALKMPKESQKLFRFHSTVFDIDNHGVETPSPDSFQKISKCSTGLTRPLGIELCAKVATPDEMFANGLPPFNGLWEVELELMKTDRQMNGWELTVELPNNMADEQTYRMEFNTPSSRVQRRAAILLRSYDQSRGFQLKVESPAASWDASASYIYTDKEWSVKSELTTGQHEKYAFETGMKWNSNGKKLEWIPVFRVSAPRMQPIAVTGAVLMSEGKKSQLSFDLHCENNDKHFVKGSLVQEGKISLVNPFRLSSDVQADFGPVSFRVFGNAEQQDKSLSADLKLDYQTPNSRKHSAKIVGKLQNLSTASFKKINSFVEAQTSQYPEANFHFSWNVFAKPQEHLENEFTLMWADQMRDQNKKIHVLQVSKATGLASGRAITTENILSVEIAPIDFKYEFKVSGNVERSQTPKYRVQLEMNNKNNKDDDVLASFEVQHVTVGPFKMTIDAALITSTRELRYNDKMEEVSPRVYKGRTQIQWEQDKKSTIGYTLKVKSDRQKTDIELDAEIKTPSMRHGLRHQGYLRSSNSLIDVQSKVYYEKSIVWDVESSLRRQGKSVIKVATKGFEGRAEAHLSASPMNMMIELKGKDYSHFSNLLIAKDAITLTSKSMSHQKPVLVIKAQKNAKDATRFNLECTMFDARVELSGRGESPASAVVEFRGKTGNKFALNTKATLSRSGGLELSGECKSASMAPHSASLKVQRASQGVSVAVHSERNNKEWYTGKALLEEIATGLRVNAQVSEWGSQVARIQSQLHRQIFIGPHDLEINIRPEASSQLQTLKIHHEIGNGEAKSVFTYFVDGVQKGQLENFARFRSSRSEVEVAAGFTLKSEVKYHGLDGVHLSFVHKHQNQRQSFQSETQVKGQMSEEQKYELKLTSDRSGDRRNGKVNVKLALQTPLYDFKQQSSEWNAEWTDEKIFLNHKTMAKDMKIFFETNIRKEDIISGPHDFRMEYRVPRYMPWSVTVRHQIVNGNVKTNVEYHSNGKKQLYAEAVGQLKSRNGQIDISGPHDLQFNIQTPSDKQAVIFHHEAQNGDIKCLLRHLIQGEEKQRLENRAQIKCYEVLDCQFSATLSLKSQLYEKLDGYTASVEHKHRITRRNVQTESKIVARKDDDLYKADVSVFGDGDSEQGKLQIRSSLQTPISAYRQQMAELKSEWSNEKITVDHKIESARVNIALKSDLSRDLVKGPHDTNLDFDVPKFRPFTAVLRHEMSGADLRTSLKVTELRNEKLIISASSRLQRTDDRIAGELEAEMSGKRLRHESEVGMKAEELALDSKTKWQDKPVATITVRLHQRKPSFVDIDCPIFKLRADADSSRVPTTGSVNFENKVGKKEQLKYRFTVEEGKSVEVHFEGKSATVPEYQADVKAQMSQESYALSYNVQKRGKELSRGEGKMEWQKGQGVRIELKNNDYSHNSDITFTGNSFTLTSESTADQKPLLVIKAHKNAKDATRFNVECTLFDAHVELSGRGESPASALFDFKGKTGDKLAINTKATHSRSEGLVLSGECKSASLAPHSAIVKVKRTNQGVNIIVSSERNNREWFAGRAQLEEISTGLHVDAQVSEWGQQVARVQSQLHRKVLSGPHDIEIDFKTPSADSQTLKFHHEVRGDEIKCQLTHHVRGQEKQRLESLVQVRCPAALECRFSATMSLKSLLYKELDGYTATLQHEHKINRKNLQAKSKLVARNAGQEYKATLEVVGNGDARQGKLILKSAIETPISEYEKQTAELNCSWSDDKIVVDHKIQATRVNIALKSNLNRNLLNGPHDLNAEVNVPRVQPFMAIMKHDMSGDEFRTELKVVEFRNKKVILNASAKLQRTHERFAGEVDAEMSGKRFKHESELLTKADELALDSETIWKNKQIAMIKGRIHKREPSFVDIDCVAFKLRADADRSRTPATGSLKFTNKMGKREELESRFTIEDGKSIEVHVQGKSASLPEVRADLKAQMSPESYIAEYVVQKRGKEWSKGEGKVDWQGQGVRANGRVTRSGKDFAQFNVNAGDDLMTGPHDMMFQFVTPRSNPYRVQMKHQLIDGNLQSSSDVHVDGKERLAYKLTGRGVLDAMTGFIMQN